MWVEEAYRDALAALERHGGTNEDASGPDASMIPPPGSSPGRLCHRANRNIAIHGELIFHTSMDDHIVALDAETGEVVWDTEILDYTVNPANQTSGPIVAGPGEPGDETWGDVPFEERGHVGSWMVPSYDPELNLVYVGTSVTSPAPKFMLGGTDLTHLYHNSTLALNGDTGEIVWHYQHMNDHWDLDHPFERLLVDTPVRPNAAAVSWINPRIQPGEERRVLTGIPGKTGIVYTLDRETGEFLWATPTITQNVVSSIDGATGQVTENAELIFTASGQQVLACPHASGGKDSEAGAYSPRTNTMYMPLRNVCARMMAEDPDNRTNRLYAIAWRSELAPGYDNVGSVQAISAETGERVWNYQQRAATMALAATGGGLVFGGDVNGRFRAFDDRTGDILWEINLGSPVSGFPITYAVDGRQYVAISVGTGRFLDLTPELRPRPVGVVRSSSAKNSIHMKRQRPCTAANRAGVAGASIRISPFGSPLGTARDSGSP